MSWYPRLGATSVKTADTSNTASAAYISSMGSSSSRFQQSNRSWSRRRSRMSGETRWTILERIFRRAGSAACGSAGLEVVVGGNASDRFRRARPVVGVEHLAVRPHREDSQHGEHAGAPDQDPHDNTAPSDGRRETRT